MTVSDLRKALKGVDGKLKVYTRDHDHSDYETNSIAKEALVIDQKEMTDFEKNRLECIFKIKGKYFVVSA